MFLLLIAFGCPPAAIASRNPASGHVKNSSGGLVQQVMLAHGHREPPSLADPMPLKAQEQGFKGKKVQHKDGETATGDWQKEFGPKGPQAPKEAPKEKKPCKNATGLVEWGRREAPNLADPM